MGYRRYFFVQWPGARSDAYKTYVSDERFVAPACERQSDKEAA